MVTWLCAWCLTMVVSGQAAPAKLNPYQVLLHSSSLAEQRAALAEILRRPTDLVPQIQKDLRDYPRQAFVNDGVVADRVVYLATLIRDPSFPPILTALLKKPQLEGVCIYACAPVFALTVYGCFDRWQMPTGLGGSVPGGDVRRSIAAVRRLTLDPEPIKKYMGSGDWPYVPLVEGKTEDELVRMAFDTKLSRDVRFVAAEALYVRTTTSRNRIDLYLLAMNELRDDSNLFRERVYGAIYRAELARAKGR